jgi:hypothetical protein
VQACKARSRASLDPLDAEMRLDAAWLARSLHRWLTVPFSKAKVTHARFIQAQAAFAPPVNGHGSTRGL